eukprot:m.211047 g.211047  ORF g.211047 m.211047 type:complete len:424 (+) comp39750_c0_seq3:337-1608(+)
MVIKVGAHQLMTGCIRIDSQDGAEMDTCRPAEGRECDAETDSRRLANDVNWTQVTKVLVSEVEGIVKLEQRAEERQDPSLFNIAEYQERLRYLAPHLYGILEALILPPVRYDKTIVESVDVKRDNAVVQIMSMILKHRSNRAAVIPTLISLLMISKGTSKQVISDLNSLGVATLPTHSWQCLEKMAERHVDTLPESTRMIWAYDNLNIMKRIRHERSDHHLQMWDMTTRLVIDLSQVPFPEFSESVRRRRQDLDEWAILPSTSDNQQLVDDATSYIMNFMAKHFKAFGHLSALCPQRNPFKEPSKSTVFPLEIVDANGGKADGNIKVLEAFVQDLKKTDTSSVAIVGDQLTCKNVRGAKRLRQPERNEQNKLNWAKESPGTVDHCFGLSDSLVKGTFISRGRLSLCQCTLFGATVHALVPSVI